MDKLNKTQRLRYRKKGFEQCSRCLELKVLEKFAPRKKRRRGRSTICRICTSRDRKLLRYRKMGVTEEQVEQDKLRGCGICGRTSRKLHVDHDHVTGKYRGILCIPHNRALGTLGDSEEGLEAALAYIKQRVIDQASTL